MTETLREALINAKAELERRNDQHHDMGTDMVIRHTEIVLDRYRPARTCADLKLVT